MCPKCNRKLIGRLKYCEFCRKYLLELLEIPCYCEG